MFARCIHSTENQNKRKIKTKTKTYFIIDKNLKIDSIEVVHFSGEISVGTGHIFPLYFQRKTLKTGGVSPYNDR